MRLTAQTDYALRILLEAAIAAQAGDGLLSIGAVAVDHRIPKNNVMKVVNLLANAGYLETLRGRGGGFRLGKSAQEIRLGDIVRLAEPSLSLADCEACTLCGRCGLTPMLAKAMRAFLAELDQQTLAEAARNTRPLTN